MPRSIFAGERERSCHLELPQKDLDLHVAFTCLVSIHSFNPVAGSVWTWIPSSPPVAVGGGTVGTSLIRFLDGLLEDHLMLKTSKVGHI
jgi:hypothetical protein